MKIFISYSLGNTDLYIASLLINEAQAKGITVATSQQQLTAPTSWTPMTIHPISLSDVVIAIATKDSQNVSSVERELQMAVSHGKPVLALIEKGLYLRINAPEIQIIDFDRHDLGAALSQVNAILESRKNQQNVNPWLVAGGLALLALYLFGRED
jgi:nitrous oxidase accessory protein NosD